MDDHFHDSRQETLFQHSLSWLQLWALDNKAEDMERALNMWKAGDNTGCEIEDITSGLLWLRDRTGIELGDIRLANVGVSSAGRSGMRDLGRGNVPDHLLARVKGRDMPQLPSAPGMLPCP